MIGLLALGHSPRPDLLAPFQVALPGVRLTLQGAMDGLSRSEAEKIAESEGNCPLYVHTKDGPLIVQQAWLLDRIEQKCRMLAEQGAELIVLLCSNDFPPIASPVPLLLPGVRLEIAVRSAASSGGRLGVIVPDESRLTAAENRWRSAGFEPMLMVAQPSSDRERLQEISRHFRESKVEQVALDCISFSVNMQRHLANGLNVPIWLPLQLAVQAVVNWAGFRG
ncbi:AroM family protein [Paenibacillus sp. NPDC058071]|uniref:AroM family protein n=1 Tax=Paenibacillus sp. NPDC058071 TaxID=3346326 RepID=UPI0036D7C835